jgi:hypothetical protein
MSVLTGVSAKYAIELSVLGCAVKQRLLTCGRATADPESPVQSEDTCGECWWRAEGPEDIARSCRRRVPVCSVSKETFAIIPHEAVGSDIDAAVTGGIQGTVNVITSSAVVVHGDSHPPGRK